MTADLHTVAIEQERALIGALLSDRDAIAVVGKWLRPGAFASGQCRVLYEAILVCWQDRIPPDPLTVDHGLRANGVPVDDAPLADRLRMMTECPVAVHADFLAGNVAAYARQRAVIDLGQALVAGAYQDPAYDPNEAYRAAMDLIAQVGPTADATGPISYDELVPEFRDRLLRGWEGRIPRVEVPTGLRFLDKALRGGLRPGDLCILAGRPGSGKTAFGLQVTHNVARRNRGRVLVYSAEMSVDSLLWRSMAEVSGVPPEHVETGKIPDHVKTAVLYATERMEGMPVSIDDTAGITVDQMIARTQRLQKREDVALVVFDYIELAGDRLSGKQDSEERRVSQISHRLKGMARSCNVPVIALCQLNRNVESRRDKTPSLADLRYSGALEADADQVMLLYRHDYYAAQGLVDPDAAREGTCDVILAKQRNGTTGVYTVKFYPETMSFSDLDDIRRGVSAA